MSFQPLHNAVVVRRSPEEDKIGSLYLPETRMPVSQILRGTVVSTGKGKHRWKRNSERKMLSSPVVCTLEVAQGDEILYYPQYEERQTIDGELVDVVAEEFVLAVLSQ